MSFHPETGVAVIHFVLFFWVEKFTFFAPVVWTQRYAMQPHRKEFDALFLMTTAIRSSFMVLGHSAKSILVSIGSMRIIGEKWVGSTWFNHRHLIQIPTVKTPGWTIILLLMCQMFLGKKWQTLFKFWRLKISQGYFLFKCRKNIHEIYHTWILWAIVCWYFVYFFC